MDMVWFLSKVSVSVLRRRVDLSVPAAPGGGRKESADRAFGKTLKHNKNSTGL
jgi:hypothetical protein